MFEADTKYKKMSFQEAEDILGDKAGWELSAMERALTVTRALNSEEEEERLAAVRVYLKNKGKRTQKTLAERNRQKKKGWVSESARHALAAKKIKTGGKKSGMIITPSYTKTTIEGGDPITGKISSIEMFVPESVAKNISEEERERIIKKYQNKENWKNPPTIAVARTEEDARKIADVFTYYLGGAEITPTPAGQFKVTSKGYYYYIGA